MADRENLKLLSEDELRDKLTENRKKLMELQFRRKSGLDKPHQYRTLKKEIAQILTAISEKKDKG